MKVLKKLWDFFTGAIPVERWVRVVTNVLKWLTQAFILLFALVLALILNSWGFTSEQRISLIHWILIMMGLVFILGIVLALLPGGPLYAPYERSLRRGKRYGTEKKPISKKKVAELPDQVPTPQLPQGQDNHEEKTKRP